MSLFVKICGINDRVAAHAALDAGASALGFVFARSPRQVTPREAARIVEDVDRSVLRVAVFRRPSQTVVDEVLSEFPADLVQADQSCLIELSGGVGRLPVIRDGEMLAGDGGMVLYESPRSGVGQTADWHRAADLATRTDLILAGGLEAENVADAIASVRPFGVDVSSGVEVAPGVKSARLIDAFVAAARRSAETVGGHP